MSAEKPYLALLWFLSSILGLRCKHVPRTLLYEAIIFIEDKSEYLRLANMMRIWIALTKTRWTNSHFCQDSLSL